MWITNYVHDASSTQTALAGTICNQWKTEEIQRYLLRIAVKRLGVPNYAIRMCANGTWKSWILTWINDKKLSWTALSLEVTCNASRFKSWGKTLPSIINTGSRRKKKGNCQPLNFHKSHWKHYDKLTKGSLLQLNLYTSYKTYECLLV